MPLEISTFDERMDAALEAVIERVAAEALAEIRAMAIFARRSIGQRIRYVKARRGA